MGWGPEVTIALLVPVDLVDRALVDGSWGHASLRHAYDYCTGQPQRGAGLRQR